MEETDGVCDLGPKKLHISRTEVLEPKSKANAQSIFRGSVQKTEDSQNQSKLAEESKNHPEPNPGHEEWGMKLPVTLKNKNLSEAYPVIQVQKKLQNEQKNISSKEKLITLMSLAEMFLKFSLTSDLNQNSEIFKTAAKVKNPDLTKKISCQVCEKINICLKLECSHITCFYCFFQSTQKLCAEKSFNALRACECLQCGLMPSLEFLSKINTGISKEMKIMRACAWCKMNLNIFEEFPQELNCGHLCLKCYLNEVYYAIPSCLACEKSFNNITFTKQRALTCKNCNSKGLSVSKGYRTLHKDHHLCIHCIVKQLTKEGDKECTCLICNEQLEISIKVVLKQFINKQCPYCEKMTFVSELTICPICNKIVCDNCSETKKCIH